jgi:Rieske 2Fe-2S family protein
LRTRGTAAPPGGAQGTASSGCEPRVMETFEPARVAASERTLERRWYVSPKVFAHERERIFARSWCYVTRAERLAQTGDYVLAELAGESLIVTRDGAGTLRAFFNVCRHRGTQLCSASAGRFGGSIQCPYHAWTYALDGRLLAARNMSEVAGFERSGYALREAAVAVADGFVFANVAPDPQPFASGLGALFGRFARWNAGALRVAREIVYELECNWKLVFQNYSECYHCPLVHPQLDELSPSDSGRNDLREGPVLGGYSELRRRGSNGSSSLTTTGTTSRPPLGEVAGADLERIYYYTIFPSMLLSLHPDYVMVHDVRPVAPNRTRVVCAWLFDPATMAAPGFDPSDAVDFWDLTNRQDWHVSELTQRGVESRAYEPGPYANQEGLLAAFDRHYRAAMGG